MINEKNQKSQQNRKQSSPSTPPTSTPPLASTTPTPINPVSANISLPLTPPNIDSYDSYDFKPTTPITASQPEIIDFIKLRQQYQLSDQSRRFEVTSLEYQELLRKLDGQDCLELKGFVEDKLRWEYNSITQTLYFPPMPTVRHDSFIEQIAAETKSQLQQITLNDDNSSFKEFASKISPIRSGNLYLKEFDSDSDSDFNHESENELNSSSKNNRIIFRQPDEQFQHKDALYPGVIFEVACSQNQKSLDKIAWDYIQYSNGDIKAVVGFELGYGKDMRARISMWKPRYTTENGEEVLDAELVIFNDPFRSSNKTNLNPTKTLDIPLDSFATSEVADLDQPVPVISITYEKLAAFLNEGEELERIRGKVEGGKKTSRKTKKRKREVTPMDLPLDSKKERKFLKAEKKEERVARLRDPSFKGKR
ncbi:hypothetical protein MFRU_078g00040 [Monilinia fructicola]|nr:hypothetical protein MFRU_078g00040 [Monilinia fructicola]